MKSFATKVVCIYANNHNLNPQFFLNFMLSPQLGIQGLPKPMNMSNIFFFFFWDGMKHDIHTFVAEWEVCQHNNKETTKASGTLQPLLIPLAI
jgi:hypothetical protein